MIEFIRLFFWLFLSRIACEIKSSKLLVLASSECVNSVRVLILIYPRYDFSEIAEQVAEMKQIADDMIREAAHE